MKSISHLFRLGPTLALAAASAAILPLLPARAENTTVPAAAAPQVTACHAPAELVRLINPLKHVAKQIASGHPLTIVAIGSSSTAGAGASSPAMSYPSQLAVELAKLLPNMPIHVVNSGVNGEESKEMVGRFDRDVFAHKPDLVLWQVGTNSILRDQPLTEANTSLHDGLKLLRAAGPDVVLINPQYAPKVITKHDVDGMVDLIHVAAKESNVDLFERFAIMRYWRLTEDIPFSTFVSSDELHMNDWSCGCIAKLLAIAIQEAGTRTTVTAIAHGRK
ncbi:MAG: SGNH/GDSL hydrolase family protein [Alphaproteobacteria bacterium]|nr:SGNH/GDSL hydrolase family protein [Alphaproteobacteria bacterium]